MLRGGRRRVEDNDLPPSSIIFSFIHDSVSRFCLPSALVIAFTPVRLLRRLHKIILHPLRHTESQLALISTMFIQQERSLKIRHQFGVLKIHNNQPAMHEDLPEKEPVKQTRLGRRRGRKNNGRWRHRRDEGAGGSESLEVESGRSSRGVRSKGAKARGAGGQTALVETTKGEGAGGGSRGWPSTRPRLLISTVDLAVDRSYSRTNG